MIAEASAVSRRINREPTARQKEILAYIREFIRVNHYPPTTKEIGAGVGLNSTSTVHNHLNTLELLGLIRRQPLQDRTIVVVGDWPA